MTKSDKKTYRGMRLEDSVYKKAVEIGEGNLTDGVRKAVTKYKIKKGK